MDSTSLGKLSSGRLRLFWALLATSFALMAAPLSAQTSPLNDTGQTLCFDAGTNALAECTVANTGDGSTHPRQDGRFGRDAEAGAGALTKIGSGEAGFDFTKVCNSGEAAGSGACPADPALGADANEWACTLDNVTGLIWEVKLDDISQLRHRDHFYTWYDGASGNVGTDTCNGTLAAYSNQCNIENYKLAVNDVSLCGATDWRVPTRRELLSIVHHGRSTPAIDTTSFPNTQSFFYWSSDIFAPNPANAWFVNFNNGSTGADNLSNGAGRVRLVSGTAPTEPNPRFVDNLDGTVTDPATGLMWDRCSSGQTWDGADACTDNASTPTHNWPAALGIAVTANNDTHRGYNDWRLPNRTELELLVDISKSTDPTINADAFPNTPSRFFWSSTVFTPNPALAWYVSFGNGISFPDGQTFVSRVRLVRSGQSFDALAAAALDMITQPSSAAQSGVIFPQQPVVEVQDANGNPVPLAGTDITAAIASGGGNLTGTTTVATDATGRATFADLTISGSVGDRTLSFSAGSLTPATSEIITLSAGPATQMAINAGNNQSAVAGEAVSVPPSVIVSDANGNPVEGVSVNFAVASGGGSVIGEAATTNADGIATVGSWTLGSAVGENTLTATSDGLTGSPLVFTATAQNAPPTAPVITAPTPGATVLIEGLLSDVFVPMWTPSTDINGDPVTYRWELGSDAQFSTLLLSVPTGSETQVTLTFEATEQLLLANGIGVGDSVTLFHRAIASDGTVEIEGSGAEVTLTLGTLLGPPDQMSINAGDGQSATGGTAVAVAPSVLVTDARANPVSGVAVAFAVASGGGSVTGASATTNASGIATVGGWTLGDTAGTNTLTATAPGLTGSPVTFNATGTAGTATQMAINGGNNQSAVAGEAVSVSPSVIVSDANGNPVQGVSVTFAVASGGGSVTGEAATTDAGGIATVGSWTLGSTAGANTLTASATDLTDVSFTATGTAGAATQMAINVGNNQSATAGTAVAIAPSVLVTDTNDNPVEGVSVTFAVASGGGSVTGEAATTDAGGIATVGSWTLGTAVGENTLTATAGGLTGSPLTFTATGTAGEATQMVLNAGDGQSATGGTAVAVAPSVRVTDANDNPVEGVSVTFAVASGDGTVDPTTPVATDANGIATVNSWTLGDMAGTNTLTASAAGLPDVTFTASATTAPAAPTDVSATPGNAEATVTWTAPTDDGGLEITGYIVTGDPDGSCSVAGDVTECTITGLTNGTAYTFTIVASNAEGDSPPSSASESVTPVGPPGGPSQVQVEPTTQGLIVSWVAPSDNGGTLILRYRAEANPSCEVPALADEVPGETAYSCTIGGLDPERDYTVTVTAINAAGESTAVAAASARPLPVIPIPTLGTWALLSLMLLMVVAVMPVLPGRSAV